MIENSETGNLKNEEGIIMRESGILMPVSSLPGPYGIGCFGAEALKFVDFLAAAGQHIWQLLPLSPTGYGDSPYQSCSAFAGNPYFIDLDALKADGLLTAAQLKAEPWGTDPLSVDYGTLYTSRYKVLRAAYAAWREKYAGRFGCAYYYPDDYYAFTLTNESWLNDYALYMALKTANGMKSWAEWPREYRLRDAGALAEFAAGQEEEIGFWKFLQYEFAVQWKKVKDYANKKGIKILGDIPIYVSADSVDAWVGGELFELDAQGGFARVAGCPPDYFSADGQLWGNPLYNWPYHKQTGYAWWVRRVRHALGIYDLLRIDHFRGFDTYWAIPAGSPTARTGKWENGPGMDLFRALEAALGKLPIIAEDLGDLVPSVRKLLADSTFPGMKVLQFAFGGGDNEYLPHNHVKNSVVYPGTHDNTTLTDWWVNAAPAKEKANAAAYLHLTPCKPTAKEVAAVRTDAARIALLRAALGSVADRAIIPMADWLGLGAEAHLNTPGKLGGNWAWRAAEGFDTALLAGRIEAECAVYCRAKEPVEKEEKTSN
jgi:4-alpha-glucanotransferase